MASGWNTILSGLIPAFIAVFLIVSGSFQIGRGGGGIPIDRKNDPTLFWGAVYALFFAAAVLVGYGLIRLGWAAGLH